MTPLLKEQHDQLRAEYSDAQVTELPDGSSLVKIPSVALPDGWLRDTTSVVFVAPKGYPFAQPDCFWADPELKLKNGAMPQGTGQNPCPDGLPHLWFSWHVSGWNPNMDTFLTYLRVIKRRFADVR